MTKVNGRVGVLALVWAIAICAPVSTRAAEPGDRGTLSVVLENDIFSQTDRDYTNGLEVAWVPHNRPAPGWAVHLARYMPWWPRGPVQHGYAFGQSVFTPQNIRVANPPLNDRPYAGWLYGALGLRIGTERQLDQVGLMLGVVGPASLAEEGQKALHRITGSDSPQGWDTQLKNEPGLVLTYQRSWRAVPPRPLGGLELDFTPHIGGALGNIFTYANTGFTLRYGRDLPPDFGPLRIEPSLLGSATFTPSSRLAWYVFAGVDARAVARNIFLDGNTFKDSRSVEKEPYVADLQLGFVINWGRTRIGYTHVLRTREFENQPKDDGFGSIGLSFAL